MCVGILYLYIINSEGAIFVTTGKQIFPIKEEQKEVIVKGEKEFDWENIIYPFISKLCGRKAARSIEYERLQIKEVASENGSKNKRSFVTMLYLPQLVVKAKLFSKSNGLVVVDKKDLKNIINEGCVINTFKKNNDEVEIRKEVRFEEIHKIIFTEAVLDHLVPERASPFDEVNFFIFLF